MFLRYAIFFLLFCFVFVAGFVVVWIFQNDNNTDCFLRDTSVKKRKSNFLRVKFTTVPGKKHNFSFVEETQIWIQCIDAGQVSSLSLRFIGVENLKYTRFHSNFLSSPISLVSEFHGGWKILVYDITVYYITVYDIRHTIFTINMSFSSLFGQKIWTEK